MTSFIVLALWSTIGLFLAARTAQPGEPRFGWAPVAVILGPLWAPVALDRQKIADDESEQRMR